MNEKYREEIRTTLEQAAAHLGQLTTDTWEAALPEQGDWFGYLRTAGGAVSIGEGEHERQAPARLHVAKADSFAPLAGNRWKVSGVWLRATDGDHYYPYSGAPSISVAADRGPKALAVEIYRRLLPTYMALLKELAGQVAQHETAVRRVAEVLAQLLEIDEDAEPFGQAPYSRGGSRYYDGDPTWTARISPAGATVELTIRHLTPDQAARLVAVVCDCREREGLAA